MFSEEAVIFARVSLNSCFNLLLRRSAKRVTAFQTARGAELKQNVKAAKTADATAITMKEKRESEASDSVAASLSSCPSSSTSTNEYCLAASLSPAVPW